MLVLDKPIIKKSIKNSKKNKNIYTFLTKRGFSLLKEKFPIVTLEKIKKELQVKPYVNTDYGQIPESFPVYLESSKKLYLPKYFGYKRFGEPHIVKLNVGDTRNIKFIGQLRDTQKHVYGCYRQAVTASLDMRYACI